jgi:hypothetical protein
MTSVGSAYDPVVIITTVFTAKSYVNLAVKIFFTLGFLPHCTSSALELTASDIITAGSGEISSENVVGQNNFCSSGSCTMIIHLLFNYFFTCMTYLITTYITK